MDEGWLKGRHPVNNTIFEDLEKFPHGERFHRANTDCLHHRVLLPRRSRVDQDEAGGAGWSRRSRRSRVEQRQRARRGMKKGAGGQIHRAWSGADETYTW